LPDAAVSRCRGSHFASAGVELVSAVLPKLGASRTRSCNAHQRNRSFALRSNVPEDSSTLERAVAVTLRSFVLLLVAYVLFHKLFPFAVLRERLADLTIGEFQLVIFRTIAAIFGAVYPIMKAIRLPHLKERDRPWCEFWSGLAFGTIALVVGSILIALLERRGVSLGPARLLARGILWLLF
jgi:hypothetical protein